LATGNRFVEIGPIGAFFSLPEKIVKQHIEIIIKYPILDDRIGDSNRVFSSLITAL
jgi:hypothetical protein